MRAKKQPKIHKNAKKPAKSTLSRTQQNQPQRNRTRNRNANRHLQNPTRFCDHGKIPSLLAHDISFQKLRD
jgi:hypothetical protein